MTGQVDVRRWTIAALALIGALAALMIIRDLMAQVTFEATTEALARARAAEHDARIWAGVLAGSAFVATVVSERMLLLVPVFTGLGVLMPLADGVVLILAVPAALVIAGGVAVAELAGRRDDRQGRERPQ